MERIGFTTISRTFFFFLLLLLYYAYKFSARNSAVPIKTYIEIHVQHFGCKPHGVMMRLNSCLFIYLYLLRFAFCFMWIQFLSFFFLLCFKYKFTLKFYENTQIVIYFVFTNEHNFQFKFHKARLSRLCSESFFVCGGISLHTVIKLFD